jgi:integrase
MKHKHTNNKAQAPKDLYAAVDLHGDNGYYCLIDSQDQAVYDKRLPNDLTSVLQSLEPFRARLAKGIAVESTFNWYWLVDGLQENGYAVQLVNPAKLESYGGLKNTSDRSDAFWLAHLQRLNLLFTQEEVQRLLNAAPFVEWQTLILLGYFVGARLRDCVQMKWEHVHPEEGVIVYQQQKSGKKVVVPMHYHVIEHLKQLSQYGTEGFLCPKLATKGPGGKHGLSEGFKRIVRKAGIDPMTVPGKGIRNFTKRTFHSLRHSFNSALANAGVAEEIRMKLTGHSSKAMNTRYTHLEVDTLKNAVTSLPLFQASPQESPGK